VAGNLAHLAVPWSGVSLGHVAPDRLDSPFREVTMADKKNPIRIELTDEQKQQIRKVTGKDAAAIEFSAEELEERVAPAKVIPSF
jgi:hypothetical protein